MTSKEYVLETMRLQGETTALAVQTASADMTSTELVARRDFIPLFSKAIEKENMLTRDLGFVVKTALGNVCKLLQNYNSETYSQEPEDLAAQWGFQWSKDPAFATDFVALATSPYAIDECCLNNDGVAKKSLIDDNVWSPDTNPEYWTDAE